MLPHLTIWIIVTINPSCIGTNLANYVVPGPPCIIIMIIHCVWRDERGLKQQQLGCLEKHERYIMIYYHQSFFLPDLATTNTCILKTVIGINCRMIIRHSTNEVGYAGCDPQDGTGPNHKLMMLRKRHSDGLYKYRQLWIVEGWVQL